MSVTNTDITVIPYSILDDIDQCHRDSIRKLSYL